MIEHRETHDPVELHRECPTCRMLLAWAFNYVMPELDLGPNGASMLIERIREIAREYYPQLLELLGVRA